MTKPHLVILDIETTGLDPEFDSILEVGAIAVDVDLRFIAHYRAVVRGSEAALEAMVPFVREMHTKNGLLGAMGSRTRLAGGFELDTELSLWFRGLGYEGKDVVVAGNSIAFDIGFLKRLPKVRGMLSHRSFDISATARYLDSLGLSFKRRDIEMPHRGLEDAMIELDELREMTDYLRALHTDAQSFRLRFP